MSSVDRPAPCPFCGCSMRVDAVARDWWRLHGDHNPNCMLASSETHVPQTDGDLAELIADWNHRAPIDRPALAGAQDERAAFEAWRRRTTKFKNSDDAVALNGFGDDAEYENSYTRTAWSAWQARAALSGPTEGSEPVAQILNGQLTWHISDPLACVSVNLLRGRHLLYLATPSDASQDAKDAARYRFLRERLLGADFDWNESGQCAIVFSWPESAWVSADCDATLDAAIASMAGQPGGDA